MITINAKVFSRLGNVALVAFLVFTFGWVAVGKDPDLVLMIIIGRACLVTSVLTDLITPFLERDDNRSNLYE